MGGGTDLRRPGRNALGHGHARVVPPLHLVRHEGFELRGGAGASGAGGSKRGCASGVCRRSEAPRAPRCAAARAAHGHAPPASPAGGTRRTSAGQQWRGRVSVTTERSAPSRKLRRRLMPQTAHAAACAAAPARQRLARSRRRGESRTSKTALAATQSSLEGGVAAARTPPAASASASSAASSAARAMARDWRRALTLQAGPTQRLGSREGPPAAAARRKPNDA